MHMCVCVFVCLSVVCVCMCMHVYVIDLTKLFEVTKYANNHVIIISYFVG